MGLVFEEQERAETWMAAQSDFEVILHRCGTGWGYTIWEGDSCVMGTYRQNWTFGRARDESERAYKEMTR